MLIPIVENPLILLTIYIKIKLRYAPPILKSKYVIGPAKIDDKMTLTVTIIKVSFKPKISKAINVTILVKPSFAPGKNTINGLGI